MDVRFSPAIHYYFRDALVAPAEGKDSDSAVSLIRSHFRSDVRVNCLWPRTSRWYASSFVVREHLQAF